VPSLSQLLSARLQHAAGPSAKGRTGDKKSCRGRVVLEGLILGIGKRERALRTDRGLKRKKTPNFGKKEGGLYRWGKRLYGRGERKREEVLSGCCLRGEGIFPYPCLKEGTQLCPFSIVHNGKKSKPAREEGKRSRLTKGDRPNKKKSKPFALGEHQLP